jgi:hypothetical protein
MQHELHHKPFYLINSYTLQQQMQASQPSTSKRSYATGLKPAN